MAPDGTSYWTQERVRFEERSTGFSVVASPDFRLSYDPARGVYDLRSEQRGATFSYCLLTGAGEPIDEARAAAAQLELIAYAEQHDDRVGVVEAKSGAGARWTVRAERDESGTTRLMAYGSLSDGAGSAAESPDDVYVLDSIFPTARGGAPVAVEPAAPRGADPPPLRPRGRGGVRAEEAQHPQPPAQGAPPVEIVAAPTPAPQPPAQPVQPAPPPAQPAQPPAQPPQQQPPPPGSFPLRDVAAADESVTGKVPDEPGWSVEAVGGIIHAVKPDRGEMWLGFQTQVTQPGEIAAYAAQAAQMFGGAPGGGQIVAPWMSADQATVNIWPRILNQVGAPYGNVRIERVGKVQNAQWASYGDFWITYDYAGAPWRGYVSMSTSPIAWVQAWRLLCSWIAIPRSGDEAVLQGLFQAAQAYRPKVQGDPQAVKNAQAIASRSNAETFGIIQEGYKIRSAGFDRVFGPRPPGG
ncbi:MAG TPA: hypothetical protein VF520_04060 [Thermoleophilaceae bacterium]|jgi:hypothetical protein